MLVVFSHLTAAIQPAFLFHQKYLFSAEVMGHLFHKRSVTINLNDRTHLRFYENFSSKFINIHRVAGSEFN